MKTSSGNRISQKLDILWFSLPIFLTGFIVLLAFYPGIMTNDSGNQIRDAIFNTSIIEGPPLYTWIIRVLINIIHKAAMISLFQVVCLAVSLGWGLSILKKHGLPWIFCLAISILFSIYPINLIYSITIWKDILYSIAVLILTIMIYQIIFSDKGWADQPIKWLGLGAILLVASFMRSNGLPVSILILVVLFIFFFIKRRRLLRNLFYSIGVFVSGYLLIVFVVYPLIGFHENRPYRYLFIHHIAAYVVNKTPLDDNARQLLNSLYPINEWKYDCYSDSTTIYIQGFNIEQFQKDESQLEQVYFDLLRRDPGIDLRHMVCSSSQVWALDIPIYKYSIDPKGKSGPLAYQYIAEDAKNISELNIYQNPLLPGLQTPIFTYIQVANLIWMPALYLYLSIVFLVLISMFSKKWEYFMLLVPAAANSLVIAVVGYSTEFRYQYDNLLVAFFLLALMIGLLIRRRKNKPLSSKASD